MNGSFDVMRPVESEISTVSQRESGGPDRMDCLVRAATLDEAAAEVLRYRYMTVIGAVFPLALGRDRRRGILRIESFLPDF